MAVEILRHGPLPRSHLARRLGLSAASLTRLSKPLLGDGLLVEAPTELDPETRRPTRPLDVSTRRARFVGVDVTGDGAWAVATDLRTKELARAHATLSDSSPEGVCALVARLVARLVDGRDGDLEAVGVALGGRVDADQVVRRAPFLGWEHPVALGDVLAARLGRPVVVGNDLAALTSSEHWFGEGRGLTSFAIVTVGAGVGYGLVLHDLVVETPDTGLQLLGHHRLDSSGPRCPAGHRGCATSLLTTSAITAAGSVALARPVGFPELLDLAARGDRRAAEVVDDAARHLGTLVASIANLTAVTRILVSGEGVEIARVGSEAMAAGIADARDPEASPLSVLVRPHDFFTWAHGAAGMAVQAYVSSSEWLAP